jgi:hypothetical protein
VSVSAYYILVFRPVSRLAKIHAYCHGAAMPEIYNHALLADRKLEIHVNDLLEDVTINDRQAYMAWLLIAFCGKRYSVRRRGG